MEKLYTSNQPNNKSPSDEQSESKISDEQKHEFIRKTKSKAAVMLIQAAQYVQLKNFRKAKQLYLDIADLCMGIAEPDQQVVSWIEISCRFLGLIYSNQQQFIRSTEKRLPLQQEKIKDQIIFKYDKFTSEFIAEESEGEQLAAGAMDKEILQYVSKINSILFGQKNISNNYSLFIMFTSYWIPFVLVIIYLAITFLLLARKDLFSTKGQSVDQFLPQIILGAVCVIPFLMVFLKTHDQRTNQFFSKKLGECIGRINLGCKKRGKQLEFILMDHGNRIKIKLTHQKQKSDYNPICDPCSPDLFQTNSIFSHTQSQSQSPCQNNK